MRYIALVFLLLLQTLIAADDSALSISVPNSVNSCSPVPLDIHGGTPPYTLSILKADNPSGPALQEFTDVRQPSSLPWSSNVAADTIITFNVKDSKGATANSGQSTVSGSCVQNQTTHSTPGTINRFDDSIPPPASNSTASNSSSNGALNPNSTTDNSTPANGTQPPSTPLTATNGSANSADVNMGSTSPINSTITPTPTPVITPNSPKNSTQSKGGSSNINNNNPKSNQTAKPSTPNKSSSISILNPLKSIHSILFTPFIVILATLI